MSHDNQDTNKNAPTEMDNWLLGRGEMAERLRTFDWSSTPLGAIETWPQSLRTALLIMLRSHYPMFIWWGRELTNIYNDAYIPMLGERHPHALGQSASSVWAELWPVLESQTEQVLNEGRATWNESILLLMKRYGFTEETYFTFSYSPAPNDIGGVGGIFCACTEDTERILSQRRLKTLRNLGERTLGITEATEEVCRIAATTLAENPHDCPFALIYLLDEDNKYARLCGATHLAEGTNASPVHVGIGSNEDIWKFCHIMDLSQSQVIENLEDHIGQLLPISPWGNNRIQRVYVLPLAKAGDQEIPAGFLVVGISPHLMWSSDYISFFELTAGHVANAISTARAYHEERKRVEALAELDRAKTAFFNNISHEFRTPLTLMLGPLESLLSQSASDLSSSSKEKLQMVNRNGVRLLRLVNSLLDFSRIEAGRVQATYTPTDLVILTKDLASSFRSTIELMGLQFVVDCRQLSEPIYVDRDMWEKIVLNLISNALKFTFNGKIEVLLHQVKDTVMLVVNDTGVGIPPEQISKIFERFHRVENVHSRTHEGSGIGLALVQELVKLHGGTIHVGSRLGEGSSFTVSLPLGMKHLPADQVDASSTIASPVSSPSLIVEEALQWLPAQPRAEFEASCLHVPTEAPNFEESAHDAHPSYATTQHSRPQVLLADDNTDMRDYVRRLLSDQYEVITVSDGKAALETVRRNPPDLVISDVMMPQLDGFGFLRELRNDPAIQTIPVILLSARAGEESRMDGLAQGADDYLVKPFSARELHTRVDTTLKMHQMRSQVQAESKKFLALAENVNEFVCMFDMEYRPSYVNPAGMAMLGLNNVSHVQQTLMKDFFFPEDHAFLINDFFPNVLHDGRAEVEIRFRHFQTGEALWMIYSVFCLYDANGHPIGLGTVSRDITKRKVAEKEIVESKKKLEEEILHHTQALRRSQDNLRKLASEVIVAEHRERRRLASELHDYLAQLLVVSRIKLGEGQHLESSLPIKTLLRETDQMIEESLAYTRSLIAELSPQVLYQFGLVPALKWLADQKMKKYDLAVTVESDVESVLLPEESLILLYQTVRELLINVVKHAGVTAAIVSIQKPSIDRLVIKVKDQGKGFYLDDSSMQQSLTKFGIFSIRERLEALEGQFILDSVIGQGTTATLLIPLEKTHKAHPRSSPVMSAPRSHKAFPESKMIRVILVDDMAMIREGLRNVLQSYANVQVIAEAVNGEEAVELANILNPDVMIMDVNMPGMNGIEATRLIRHISHTIKVIGLSINDDTSIRNSMLQAGAVNYLAKDSASQTLYEAICAACANRNFEQANNETGQT
ncbi:MAG: hypothetical protein NPIRA01_37310 [Nitrospirales bacterium]|nr:MAG: hypothetical protein NPIRA01_37310 [Nitrospirales bacterium]